MKGADKKLTHKQIMNLPIPATGFTEYSVGGVTGLRVRVTAAGTRSWVFRYKVGKKNNTITLGCTSNATTKEAEAWAKGLRHEITLGRDPAQERRNLKEAAAVAAEQAQQDEVDNPPFKQFGELYITRYAKKNKRSWLADEGNLRRHIVPVIGDKRIKDITRRDIVGLLNGMRDKGLTTVSNRVRALLHHMFNWAIQQVYVEVNPAYQTERLKERARGRVLTYGEIRHFWEATDKSISGLALRMVLVSGQRPGEVIGMKWADINDGVWLIPLTKNGTAHTVPISTGMQTVLDSAKAMGAGGDYVFSANKNKRLILHGLASTIRMMRWECDPDNKPRPHDLRRTAITAISRLGHNRTAQNKLANHADKGVEGVYDRHTYLPEKLQALEDLWAELRRITTGDVVVEISGFVKRAGR